MTLLFFILIAIFILFPLGLEAAKKGWRETIVVKAWAELAPAMPKISNPLEWVFAKLVRFLEAAMKDIDRAFEKLGAAVHVKIRDAIYRVVHAVTNAFLGKDH
jgi:hypothetical protein